jgi:hypothetical protein
MIQHQSIIETMLCLLNQSGKIISSNIYHKYKQKYFHELILRFVALDQEKVPIDQKMPNTDRPMNILIYYTALFSLIRIQFLLLRNNLFEN